ncbi:hypothetical protein GS504_01450 [Rhodococcus hoagii]|nr:hypothetical protein [Prescottella equi]NKS71661.1 hypothetical protein [Prescottella equi]
MSGQIVFTVLGHWVNAWFLRLASRPVLLLDGCEYPARWGQPTTLSVDAGAHRMAAGLRYRGTPWLLGIHSHEVYVADGRTVYVNARNGAVNSEPFHLTVSDPP